MKSTKNPIDVVAAAFYFPGQSSLAKSIIFLGIKNNLPMDEYIPSIVMAYYSVFHLTISLMYFCPQFLQKEQRNKLYQIIQAGRDPTLEISHNQAINFLSNNLDKEINKLHAILKKGRELREFVNYAPRIIPNGLGAIFDTCQFNVSEFKLFLSEIDQVIRTSIQWGMRNPPVPELTYLKISLSHMQNFLTDPDLGYSQWVSPSSLESASDFIRSL